jgi:hypothetical protein
MGRELQGMLLWLLARPVPVRGVKNSAPHETNKTVVCYEFFVNFRGYFNEIGVPKFNISLIENFVHVFLMRMRRNFAAPHTH